MEQAVSQFSSRKKRTLTTHLRCKMITAMLTFSMAAFCGDTLHVTFTGDLLLDRGVRKKIAEQGIDALFSPSVDSMLKRSDIVVANLECPTTHINATVQKQIMFRADPECLPHLRQHGITHLTLANNHSVDQGRRGLADTWQNIRDAGMTPVGAGRNMEEAARPELLATTPRNVWLLTSLRLSIENFPYLPDTICVSQEPFPELLAKVERLRRSDPHCYIAVALHWGGENTFKPLLQQVADAHRLVEAGADIIIGHHPHTLQKVETYRGKVIYYSIGNFIFDAQRPFHDKAYAVTVAITAQGAEVATVPLVITDSTPAIRLP